MLPSFLPQAVTVQSFPSHTPHVCPHQHLPFRTFLSNHSSHESGKGVLECLVISSIGPNRFSTQHLEVRQRNAFLKMSVFLQSRKIHCTRSSSSRHLITQETMSLQYHESINCSSVNTFMFQLESCAPRDQETSTEGSIWEYDEPPRWATQATPARERTSPLIPPQS